MRSLILQTATRLLTSLLVVFSVFLLWRGHNEPGGGFAGGLVLAGAFALYGVAHDFDAARRLIRVDPAKVLGVGLLVAAGSGMISLLQGSAFMTGLWTDLHLAGLGDLHLGTPLLFDIGVYLVVFGVIMTILIPLEEDA